MHQSTDLAREKERLSRIALNGGITKITHSQKKILTQNEPVLWAIQGNVLQHR